VAAQLSHLRADLKWSRLEIISHEERFETDDDAIKQNQAFVRDNLRTSDVRARYARAM